MPKKKQPEGSRHPVNNPNVMGLRAAVVEQPITDTLETNYMPYAMSVIVSRAIPEIDGFKPSHRKLLYTMYKMGLLTGARTKSANIVGQTMRLNRRVKRAGGGPVRQGHTSPPGDTAFHQCILEYNLLRSPDGKSHHLHA